MYKNNFSTFYKIVKCQAKSKSVLIGDKYSGPSSDLFDSGNDYVFVFLPCDKSKYSIDLSASAKKLAAKNRNNFFRKFLT